MQQFELSCESAGSPGRLVISRRHAMHVSAGCRRASSAGLCASISANAAPAVLGHAPVAVLAQEAQHSLLVAAAVVRTFVVGGSTHPLRRRTRDEPAPKLGSRGGRTAAAAAATATTAASSTSTPGMVPAGAAAAAAAARAQQARGLQQFLAGGIAGAVSKTLVAPMERISTLLMADAQRFSVKQAAQHAWSSGLYRGHAATLIKIFPASAIQFAVFNGLKDRILAGKQQPAAAAAAAGTTAAAAAGSAGAAAGAAKAAGAPAAQLANYERLLAGAAAGAAAACACYPLESMRTMMSVAGGVSGNLLQVGRHVVAAHGLGALYRGFRASLLGDILGNSLGFTAYEMFTGIYRDCHGGASPPPHLRGVIGSCSAACVVTLTMPLEVVRRRLQVQGLAGRPILYRGTFDCLRTILRQEGIKGFYAASLPSYLKVAPSIGCMYFLYELMTNMPAPAPAPAAAGSGTQ